MQLPEIRRTVFLYICAFLKELLSHTQDNGLDAKTLGNILNFNINKFQIFIDCFCFQSGVNLHLKGKIKISFRV